MPTHQTVERFVKLVEAGKGLEALDLFYAGNASMQENQATPRVGKAALRAGEAAAQAAVSDMTARCVRPILIEGDVVVMGRSLRCPATIRRNRLAIHRGPAMPGSATSSRPSPPRIAYAQSNASLHKAEEGWT